MAEFFGDDRRLDVGRNDGNDYGEPRRAIRLDDERWDALEAIAAAHGLTHGGLPSRGAAIRWLIDQERERLASREGGRADVG